MILYDNVCTPCARKQKWRELRNFAREHKLLLKRFDISKDAKARQEAEAYELDIPFIVHGKIALSLTEPLERLL